MTSIQKPSTASAVYKADKTHDRLKIGLFSFGILFMSLGVVTLAGSIIALNIWAAVISAVIVFGAILLIRKTSDWADNGLEYTPVPVPVQVNETVKESNGVQQ